MRTDKDERAAQWTAQLMLDAVQRGASDIHIEPTSDERGKVRLRVDGALHTLEPPPPDLYAAIVHYVKTLTCLDLSERHASQDGRVMLKLEDGQYDFRVHVMPTVRGEDIEMRILNQQIPMLALQQIASADLLGPLRRLCRLSHGAIISTGPTGSGKTTLMYSMLLETDRDQKSVFSIEDPVEVLLDGVTQIQVRPQHGVTFSNAITSVMRHDPDVLMIGEVRDLETAEMAIKIALLGHLVFTQMNAVSAAEAVRRLLDMGNRPFMITSAITAVISQRLVRCLCERCKQPADPQYGMLPPPVADFLRGLPDKQFYAAKGCDACSGTGHKRRKAVHELLLMNDRVSSAVTADADKDAIHNAAVASGMRPMLFHGLELVARGEVSLEEVWRVVGL